MSLFGINVGRYRFELNVGRCDLCHRIRRISVWLRMRDDGSILGICNGCYQSKTEDVKKADE